MQETSSIPCEEQVGTPTNLQQTSDKVTMSHPRKPILDWFLAFSTFGLYFNFWLYRRIREINQISKENFKPWLWIFVPLFFIAQAFAFRNLDRALDDLEGSAKKGRSKSIYWLGVSGFMLANVYFSMSSKWTTPLWLELLMLLLSASSFAAIASRVNEFKRQLVGVEFTGKERGYNAFEWCVVLIMTPLILAMFAFLIGSTMSVEKLESYSDRSIYTQPEHNFQLTFHGPGWQRVENGTHSDGTALAEFESEDYDAYFVLFDNKEIENLNEHMALRRDWIKEEIGKSECEESRSFVGNEFALKVELVCNKKLFNDPASGYVTLINTGDKTYELLGVLSQPRLTYRSRKPEFEAMAREFSLQ